MAITDKKTGVWGLDQVYNKENQGSIWEYVGAQQLTTWGRNEKGQLALNTGPGDQGSRSSPVQVGSLETWKSISYGIATRSDGTLWTWGDSGWGQMGTNESHPGPSWVRSSPVQVPGTTWGTELGSVFRAQSQAMAVKTDGSLWMWGANNSGNLGQNNKTARSSPVQVPGSTWGSGYQQSMIAVTGNIKTDGTLWVWGNNSYGDLGQGDNTNYSSPVQVPGTTWRTVSSAYNAVIATKTDGTLWCWGNNEVGQLGLSNRTDYSSPKQVPGTTWKNGTAGYGYCLATKTDGTLWAWGGQSNGQLGLNQTYGTPSNRKDRSSPVQVPGTTWDKPIQQMHTGGSGAFKTDGTLWLWGDNEYGQVGDNNLVRKSSPVQVPGDWKVIAKDQRSTTGIRVL